ncbi:putative membrane protein (plasmid) [Pseudomonas cerasi]|nr:putative membrane protein [Pseudomonas cerasi]CZT26344.1 putative membrane protein [Pseudomonas cerasi]
MCSHGRDRYAYRPAQYQTDRQPQQRTNVRHCVLSILYWRGRWRWLLPLFWLVIFPKWGRFRNRILKYVKLISIVITARILWSVTFSAFSVPE